MQSNSVSHPITYVAALEKDVCRSFGRLLRAAGFHPVTYHSEAFLRDTKRPQFDCRVVDIQLRGMSGLKLSRAPVEAGDRWTENKMDGVNTEHLPNVDSSRKIFKVGDEQVYRARVLMHRDLIARAGKE